MSVYFIIFFKVDFFWINREQRSFEWFVSLLSQLEIEQAEQGGAMERFLGKGSRKKKFFSLWPGH